MQHIDGGPRQRPASPRDGVGAEGGRLRVGAGGKSRNIDSGLAFICGLTSSVDQFAGASA
jgi:hypothetical protein